MTDALRVRGVPSARLAVRLRVAAALPAGWLARMVTCAVRVGDAMEVRGFDGRMPTAPAIRFACSDWMVMAGSALLAAGALILRWRSPT